MCYIGKEEAVTICGLLDMHPLVLSDVQKSSGPVVVCVTFVAAQNARTEIL